LCGRKKRREPEVAVDLGLTEWLVCPRCGPAFGLVLLAERVEEHRLLEGVLGCARCRERYPVRGGFAEFRPDARGAPAEPAPVEVPAEEALRLAALLGLEPGPAGRIQALLAGAVAGAAQGIVELLPDVEVVAVHGSLRDLPEVAGISRIAVGERLPLRDAGLRGVALAGEAGGLLLEEAARVLRPTGRLVLRNAPGDARRRLAAAGARVVVEAEGILVAGRAG
jgi:uncharacterized protein YbaR (Trm112 family)